MPRLGELVTAGLVRMDDAALVSWPRGHRKPSARELGDLSGPGMLSGGAWGIVLALIFVVPIAGPAFGAAAGAFAGALAEFGIDDDFVKDAREAVTPGTSALFLLGDERLPAGAAELGDHAPIQVLRTALAPDSESRLRLALGEESTKG